MAQTQAHLPTPILDYEDQHAIRSALESCTACSELDWKVANLDTKTSEVESLDVEIRRLQVLRSYRILDTGRKGSFERLTALAARIFDVPICLVSLVDLDRQWFASNRGLGDVRQTPRSLAFCAHAILSKLDLFIVPDTFEDVRFRDHGLVTGDPKIRFYAGAPLVTPEGYKLGTFCIIDRKPRPNGLSLAEKQNLREIAAMAMDQIQESKVDAEKCATDQSRQIASTAHDLITPLTSIQLNVGLLSEDEELLKHLSKDQREIITNTKECVDIMSSICQQSIQVFRGQRPHSIDLSNHEVGTVNIPKLLKSLEHVISTYPKKVPLKMRVDDDVPPVIKGDMISMFRSSLNFLTNACKVTEVGSIEFHLSIRYAISDGSDGSNSRNSLLCQCIDTGPGIDKKQIHDLFSPDGGLRMSQESDYGGTGLGLHSVSELMSGCGGEYGYQARHGTDRKLNGSIFWFSVPAILPEDGSKHQNTGSTNSHSEVERVEVDMIGIKNVSDVDWREELEESKHNSPRISDSDMEASTPLGAVAEPTRAVGGELSGHASRSKADDDDSAKLQTRKKYALVIDDSKTIRKVLERALSNFGFEVRLAENGMQGLEKMKSKVFDIVLCDFLMPIMDGLDCVKQYREWESSHRAWFEQFIVGVSAHADGADGDRGLKVGMSKFISKPLPMRILKRLIESDELNEISNKLDSIIGDDMCFPYFINSSTNLDSLSRTSSISAELKESSPTCLLVEDTTTVSKAMMRCIELKGWKCSLAKDGEEGLRLLKTRNWDAVFMDGQLPLLTGMKCISIFREWEKTNRVARQKNVYLCSADYEPNSSTPEGFNGVFGKPFKPAFLGKVLDDCIENVKKASLI